MSVRKEASGRRSVQVEVEVPGTPEEVWQAIASGPGISSWFVPTEVDGRPGGSITCEFGPGMKTSATINEWQPPNRLSAESPGSKPGAPPMATEWIVEARDGGTCIVRVVHSLFAETDDWNNQLEHTESGWPEFFHVLRLYLAHFRGQRCKSFQQMAMTTGPMADVWEKLVAPVGFAGAAAGERRASGDAQLPLAGVVESAGTGKLLVRVDQPAPGLAQFFAMDFGGPVCVGARFYLYGEGADAAVGREGPRWAEWLQRQFPTG